VAPSRSIALAGASNDQHANLTCAEASRSEKTAAACPLALVDQKNLKEKQANARDGNDRTASSSRQMTSFEFDPLTRGTNEQAPNIMWGALKTYPN
jgi:hypothetical protein